MEKFWVVVRDTDRTKVIKRHAKLPDAMGEAVRLCKKENASFIILEAVAVFEPIPVEIEVSWKLLKSQIHEAIGPEIPLSEEEKADHK